MNHKFFTPYPQNDSRTVPRGTAGGNRRVFLAALAGLLLLGCSSKRDESVLVVGMDLSYPPFETIDERGQPAGVSVEIARGLAQSLGRELRIENMPFVGLIPSLQNGRIDCVISSMTDTPERRESIAFSDPYLTIGLAMLVGTKSEITDLASLDRPDNVVVVRQGTTGEVWARKAITRAKVLAVDKEGSAVLEVIQGKADAFVYDQMSVWQNAQKHPAATRAILPPIQKEVWAIGVRKDDPALLAAVNRFLAEFRKRGGFDELGDRFLGEQKKAFRKEGIPFYF